MAMAMGIIDITRDEIYYIFLNNILLQSIREEYYNLPLAS